MSDSFAAPRTEVCQAALSMGFGNKDDIMLGFQISLALENLLQLTCSHFTFIVYKSPQSADKYFIKWYIYKSETLFFWAPKSLQMVTAAVKLKDTYSLEGKL